MAPSDTDEEDKAQRDSRLSRWCEQAAGGDWEAFEKRLAWDGLDVSQARHAVESVYLKASAALPAWTETLQDCFVEAANGEAVSEERFLDENEPIPFEHLLAHFVSVGRQRLSDESSRKQKRATDHAMSCLERNLLRKLSKLSVQILYSQFIVYSAVGSLAGGAKEHTGEGGSHAPALGSSKDSVYQAFVQSLCGSELRALFLEYSVWARLITTVVDAWVRNSAALLNRLHEDWDEIVALFADGAPGVVADISKSLSDPHNGGATTFILKLEDDRRILYKPKDVGACAAFQGFVAWCNEQGLRPALRVIKVLERSGYGWVEHIEKSSCESEGEAEKFYQRSGALLCLVHKLNGRDFHRGNVIAHGEHPVLIDLEVMMQPSLDRATGGQPEEYTARAALSDTVLSTGMLPTRVSNPYAKDDSFVDAGALLGDASPVTRQYGWTAVNTDEMKHGYQTVKSDQYKHLPELEGQALDATNYRSEILHGFEEMYGLLLSSGDACSEAGPLSLFAGQATRFLFRSTGVYDLLLRRLRHPKYMREGIDRDLELESLRRGYVGLSKRPVYWSVVESEIRSLNRLDVPAFRSSTTNCSLTNSGGKKLGNCFETPGYEVSQTKLATLDRQDMVLQCSLIKGSLYTSQVDGVHEGVRLPDPLEDRKRQETSTLTPETAVGEAHRILGKLKQRSIENGEGQVTWMSLAPDAESGRFTVREIGSDLHHGRCGLALFFASLAAVASDSTRLRNLAIDTIRPVVEQFTDDEDFRQLSKDQSNIGGTVGIGSYVYGLSQVGTLLESQKIVEAASAASSFITPEKIKADDDFDIVSGAAGAALALLTLYRRTGDERALEKALQCGEHLIECRTVESYSGVRAWCTQDERFQTGFAHGAAGIAHALADLYRLTEERRFLDCALEAFSFERALFSSEAGNWYSYPSQPRKTQDPEGELWSTWCHGATGIGLARIANIDLFTTDEQHDVELAIRATKTHLSYGVDHACCGDMGRICFMAAAGEALSRPSLADEAAEAAGELIARSYERGGFVLTRDKQEMLKPGFLQGLSGIGQTLLQITHPQKVPSVLLLR